MVSSSSRCTPRSRTTVDGLMDSDPIHIEQSRPFSLARFERDPNQITSVLLAFSCSRRDAHHVTPDCYVCYTLRQKLPYGIDVFVFAAGV